MSTLVKTPVKHMRLQGGTQTPLHPAVAPSIGLACVWGNGGEGGQRRKWREGETTYHLPAGASVEGTSGGEGARQAAAVGVLDLHDLLQRLDRCTRQIVPGPPPMALPLHLARVSTSDPRYSVLAFDTFSVSLPAAKRHTTCRKA